MSNTKKKIAIVYDWIDKWGGVERVLLHLHTLFPSADFFTSSVNLTNAQWASELPIQSTFLQSYPEWIKKRRSLLTPLYPIAFESLQFDSYDLVISITSAFAKGIITKPQTKHICYLLTPPRYLWGNTRDYLSGFLATVAKPITNHLRKWDKVAAHRPDAFISISQTVADRAQEIYNINSPVLFPPFDTAYWDSIKKKQKKSFQSEIKSSYYLSVGRMESYKKCELLIEVARKLPHKQFVFVGTGTQEKRIKNTAPKNCLFTGLISDYELSYLYAKATALLMPQNEDFGYVSLEAQYHGCPVVAFLSGGACETVIEGETGLFFQEQTVSSVLSVLERYEQISYNLSHSTQGAKSTLRERFGIERFNNQFFYQLNHINSI